MDPELAGWLREGRTLHDHRRYGEAVALYQRILQARPGEPYVLYELAYSLYAQRELRQAITHLEQVLRTGLGPTADAHGLLGSIHDQLGDLARGEQVFRAGLKRFPAEAMLYFNLGVNLMAQRQAEAATQELLANLTIRPDHARGWAVIGDARWATGHRAWALLAWARCLMVDPDPTCASMYAARLWERLFAGIDFEARAITIPTAADTKGQRDVPQSAENMAVAVTAASRRNAEWSARTDAEFFAHALDTIVAILGELGAAKHTNAFWGRLLTYFEAARAAGHLTAMAYEIRNPLGDPATASWLAAHADAREHCRLWSRGGPPAPR